MKKVIVMLADGFEEMEAVTPVDLLRRAGFTCITISIMKGKIVNGARGICMMADEVFYDEMCDADAIILPGGMQGTLALKKHDGLKKALLKFNKEKKIIAAICAAPTILGELGLLKGKKAVAYPGLFNELKGALPTDLTTVQDGNIITSTGAGTAIDFSLKVISALADNDTMVKVKEAIVFSA